MEIWLPIGIVLAVGIIVLLPDIFQFLRIKLRK